VKRDDVKYLVLTALLLGYASGVFASGLRGFELPSAVGELYGTKAFFLTAAVNALPILATGLSGYSLIGFAFVLPAVFYRSFCMGAAVSVYVSYGVHGIVTGLLGYFPTLAVSIAALYILGYGSLRFSLSSLFGRDISLNMKYHTALTSITLVFVILCSVWESYISIYFYL